jgi:formate hydrogenlyase subunit 3/multisubunit Na+/H+ antiporter MnhD subunit
MVSILVQAIGWIGAVMVVGAYLLLTTKKIRSGSRAYQLLNLFGSIGVLVNALAYGAFPSVAINVVWFVIAIYGLSKTLTSIVPRDV